MTPDTLAELSEGFLQTPTLRPERGGIIATGTFNLDRFVPGLFECLKIVRPDSLSRAVDKRVAEFLAGRAMAHLAQDALGLAPHQVRVGANRAPIWPAGVAGSISHSRGRCACFLLPHGLGTPGIDVEDVVNGPALESILAETMSGSEVALVLSSTQPALVATLGFSAKESMFKALHPTVGQFFGFECALLRTIPVNGRLELRLTEAIHPTLLEGHSIEVSYETGREHVLTWLVHVQPFAGL